jgi:signal peptidase II
MGGSIGNGFDRIAFGTVTDFINFHFWPVFNVADSAISIGVVALLAGYVLRKPDAA